MGSRSTYERRIEQRESAPRAVDAAVDDLLASPHAQAGCLILDGAERPLLRDGRGTFAARLLLSLANDRPRAPVA
jgi:hypothetical protein